MENQISKNKDSYCPLPKPLNNNNSSIKKEKMFILSPTVAGKLDRECNKKDFITENNDNIKELGIFGKCHLVTHNVTEINYAIKVVHKDKINKIERSDFKDEINKVLLLMYNVCDKNDYVLKLLTHFEDDANLYLLLNYSKSSNLKSLRELLNESKKLQEETVIKYIYTIILVLIDLQEKGIIFVDLQPESIYIDKNNNIILSDYCWSSIAYKLDSQSRKLSKGFYISPEVFQKMPVNKQTVVWSIGMLAYELLTGTKPFFNKEINKKEDFNINYSECLSLVMRQLLEKMLKINFAERINLENLKRDLIFKQYNLSDSLLIDEIDRENGNIINIAISKNKTEKLKEELDAANNKIKSLQKSLKDTQQEKVKLKNELDNVKNYIGKSSFGAKDVNDSNINLINLCSSLGESVILTEKNEKLRNEYLNKDRLSKLAELEEKQKEIINYRSQIRRLENDLEIITMNCDELRDKNTILLEEIKNLTFYLDYEKSDKETKVEILNAKIEYLQDKILGSNNGEEVNKNFCFLLSDSVNEFKVIVNKLLKKSNEENQIYIKNIEDIMDIKENEIKEIIVKTKEEIQIDIKKRSLDNNNFRPCERLDWLKKQINELIPYKIKAVNQEAQITRLESELKRTYEKLFLSETKMDSIIKLGSENKNTIRILKNTSMNLENKLSDIKHYIAKNFPEEKVEELFKDYSI